MANRVAINLISVTISSMDLLRARGGDGLPIGG